MVELIRVELGEHGRAVVPQRELMLDEHDERRSSDGIARRHAGRTARGRTAADVVELMPVELWQW